jgi:ferredoxin
MHQVKNPRGQEQSFKCADTQYILDAAEAAGLEIPNRCVAETGNRL